MGTVTEMIPGDRRDMVAALEGLLELVETGEVVGFAYLALRKGQDPQAAYAGPPEACDVHQLLSAIEHLKFRILMHQLSDQ
jgi:hypothetical protein